MELVKFDNPIPIKAIPEETLNRLMIEFSVYLSNLLSLNDNQSKERLKYALPSIKNLCWSMGFPEIKKMFEMYADNQLGIQPRSNYFDRILVGQIYETYKAVERSKHKPKPEKRIEISEEEKKRYAYLNCIISFDNYKQEKIMDKSDWVVYDELDSRKLLNFTKKEKLEAMSISKERYDKDHVERAKSILLERYYQQLITKDKHIKELI